MGKFFGAPRLAQSSSRSSSGGFIAASPRAWEGLLLLLMCRRCLLGMYQQFSIPSMNWELYSISPRRGGCSTTHRPVACLARVPRLHRADSISPRCGGCSTTRRPVVCLARVPVSTVRKPRVFGEEAQRRARSWPLPHPALRAPPAAFIIRALQHTTEARHCTPAHRQMPAAAHPDDPTVLAWRGG